MYERINRLNKILNLTKISKKNSEFKSLWDYIVIFFLLLPSILNFLSFCFLKYSIKMKQEEFVDDVVKALFMQDDVQNICESYLYRIENLDKINVKFTTQLAIAAVLIGSRQLEMYTEALKILISISVLNNISSNRSNSYNWALKELIRIVFDNQLHHRDKLIQETIPENMLIKQTRTIELASQLKDTYNYVKLDAPKQTVNEIIQPVYDEYNNLINQEDLQKWAKWLRSLYFLKETRRIDDFVPWFLKWVCGLLVEAVHIEKLQVQCIPVSTSTQYSLLIEEKDVDNSSNDESSIWSDKNENNNNENQSSNIYLNFAINFFHDIGKAIMKYFEVRTP